MRSVPLPDIEESGPCVPAVRDRFTQNIRIGPAVMSTGIGRSKLWTGIVAVVWIGLIGVGFHLMMRYASTPGRPAAAPVGWPVQAGLKRTEGRMALVVFFHPGCSCSRSSLEELVEILSRRQAAADVWVVFDGPSSGGHAVRGSEFWNSAERIPGVQVVEDRGGAEAARFGARTSGQALLYDQHGQLIFQGGITGARGMVGENDGEAAVAELLSGRTARREVTPVFGCGLATNEKRMSEKTAGKSGNRE